MNHYSFGEVKRFCSAYKGLILTLLSHLETSSLEDIVFIPSIEVENILQAETEGQHFNCENLNKTNGVMTYCILIRYKAMSGGKKWHYRELETVLAEYNIYIDLYSELKSERSIPFAL